MQTLETSPLLIFVFGAFIVLWGSIPFTRLFRFGNTPTLMQTGVLQACQFMKGALPVFLFSSHGLGLWGGEWLVKATEWIPSPLPWFVGLLVAIGHTFLPWAKSQEGSAATVALGMMALLSPYAAIAGGIGFVICHLLHKNIALSNISGAGAGAVVHLVVDPSRRTFWILLILIFLILLRHEKEMDALLQDPQEAAS